MKVDKANPRHWLRLVRFGLAVACAIAIRPLHRRQRRTAPLVLFYGHRLSGNLLPIYQMVRADQVPGLEAAFLTMDPAYKELLDVQGERTVLAGSMASIRALAMAVAVVSDHGLHVMQPMLRWTDARFFDVWHGIPFKGFDADDFRVQHQYDESWVASPCLQDLYVEKFGFDRRKVHVTGYARTDAIVHGAPRREEARRAFGLPANGRIVLFAPTWKQDDEGRSVFPFGVDADLFLRRTGELVASRGATLAVRMHLNSPVSGSRSDARVVDLPFADFPDTEQLLVATDVLICDWSSIAFDFVLLHRPTVFLNVPHPFKKGLSLGDEFRYGEVVDSLDGMLEALALFLDQPSVYLDRHGAKVDEVIQSIHGGRADGRATARCVARLAAGIGLSLRA